MIRIRTPATAATFRDNLAEYKQLVLPQAKAYFKRAGGEVIAQERR